MKGSVSQTDQQNPEGRLIELLVDGGQTAVNGTEATLQILGSTAGLA
jgi:hypothetical protein